MYLITGAFMAEKQNIISKYKTDVKEIILDCTNQSSTDIDTVNMLLSALEIFASQEGISQTEWQGIVSTMTEGIPGEINFRAATS